MTTENTTSATVDKYELVPGDSITIAGTKLYRIKALRDILRVVKKGEFGGYISEPECLAQEGNCWVDYHSRVYDGARVQDDAVLLGASTACSGAIFKDSAYAGGRVELIGRILVANQERIEPDYMLINATVEYASQYSRNGSTVFTFDYRANGVGATIGIPVSACRDKAALALSLLRQGKALSLFRGYEGEVQVVPVDPDTGCIRYSEVLELVQAQRVARRTV
jgi:hypothetical protein